MLAAERHRHRGSSDYSIGSLGVSLQAGRELPIGRRLALHRLDPDGAQDLGIRLAAHDRAHLVTMLAQARCDMPADYPVAPRTATRIIRHQERARRRSV